jgi:hypothetical protein
MATDDHATTTRTVLHRSCSIKNIPPYCFLRPGVSTNEAIGAALESLGATDSASILYIAWVMRATAEGRR